MKKITDWIYGVWMMAAFVVGLVLLELDEIFARRKKQGEEE